MSTRPEEVIADLGCVYGEVFNIMADGDGDDDIRFCAAESLISLYNQMVEDNTFSRAYDVVNEIEQRRQQKAPAAAIRELAQCIANQAQALADGTVLVPHGMAALIADNAKTLAEWLKKGTS